MKTILLSLFLVLIYLPLSAKIWTISNSGMTFTPELLTVDQGDSIQFAIGSTHNVIEVSKAIWDVNEASPLSGGFQLPYGGGMLLPSQLPPGIHYFVCLPHVTMGMKGSFTVLGPASIPFTGSIENTFISPNPATDVIIAKAGRNSLGSMYTIIDLLGKKVAEGKLENNENPIEISHLPPGAYFFQTGLHRKEVLRFIKD